MDQINPRRILKGALHLIFSKTVLFSALAVALSAVIFAVSYLNNVIYITDGNTTTVTVTTERDAMKILANENIITPANDRITYEAPSIGSSGQLTIQRGFPVSVTVDGATHTVNWIEGQVEDLLETTGVTLGAHDKITHEIDHEMRPYENVVITRVAYRSYDVPVTLPKEVTYKSTSLIKYGTSRVLQAGTDGLRIDSYDEILEDGQVVETLLASSTVTKEPTEEIVLVGDGSAISRLDYSASYPLDENGIPINYKYVLHNQRATGYWRAGRAWGASGEYCMAGTVAVRANEIPYGTKMYIRTPDGNFIYGYAVANDTGTGLMQGIIDVDLFYETYEESCLNSVRWVDIYILE